MARLWSARAPRRRGARSPSWCLGADGQAVLRRFGLLPAAAPPAWCPLPPGAEGWAPAPVDPGGRVLAAAGFLVFLGLPLLALVLRVDPGALLAAAGRPGGARGAAAQPRSPARRRRRSSSLLGAPVAYLLATREFPGKRVVEVLVDLPMVLPPTVAGLALLLAFGRMGLGGRRARGGRALAAVHDARGRRRAGLHGGAVLHRPRARRLRRRRSPAARRRGHAAGAGGGRRSSASSCRSPARPHRGRRA